MSVRRARPSSVPLATVLTLGPVLLLLTRARRISRPHTGPIPAGECPAPAGGSPAPPGTPHPAPPSPTWSAATSRRWSSSPAPPAWYPF